MINYEGGAIPEEYHNEYVIDRLETTATVWMSMTVGCARCHDHKYDPITQKDFYRFYAFFNSVPEKGLDGQRGNAVPMLQLPSKPDGRLLTAIQRKIAKTERKLPKPEIDRMEFAWRATALSEIPNAPADGLRAHFAFEDNLAGLAKSREVETRRGEVTYVDGQVGRAARLSGQTHVTFGQEHSVGDHPFSIALWMRASQISAKSLFHKIADAESRTGLELFLGESEKPAPTAAGKRSMSGSFTNGPTTLCFSNRRRSSVSMTGIKSRSAPMVPGRRAVVSVYLNGKAAEMKVTLDSLSGSIANSRPIGIGDASVGEPYKGDIDDLRVYDRVLGEAEVEQLAVHEPIRAILSSRQPDDPCAQFGDLPAEKRTKSKSRKRESRRKKAAAGRKTRHCVITTSRTMRRSVIATPTRCFAISASARATWKNTSRRPW